ncbi:unnamed protein product [Mesocestoides corti]|uniref:HEAT repeat-containing protein 5B n=1 Tax=Mesocestoides corti TaxID=53468 RepID=A0A158QW41_MESCO|nr:unnamed protein product [Mesocestoides corti]
MDSQPGLLLNDAAFARVTEQNKPVFIYDWLRSLDRRLSQSTKTDVKNVQQSLTDQLMVQVSEGVGPPSRKLLGRCLSKIFITGDSIALYGVLNSCNDILKIRDDGPAAINKRLTALTCLGIIYRSLGRLCGRSFEETVGILTKMIKQVESQTRCEILTTLRLIVAGFGAAESLCFRDIFKVAKSFINDRVLSVRLAAVQCHNSLAQSHPSFYTNDLNAMMSMCVKGLDGSNHAVRIEIAKLLGRILAKTQLDLPVVGGNANSVTAVSSASGSSNQSSAQRGKSVNLDDVLALLSSAFLRGPGRFHKGATASDMLKGTNIVSREVRAGISYAYVEFFSNMGSDWLVANSMTVISHCLSLLANPRSTQTPNEANFTRSCVGSYILSSLFRRHFSEAAQIAAARHLVRLIASRRRGQNGAGRSLRASQSTGQLEQEADSAGTSEDVVVGDDPHYLVCCLDALTELIRWLDSTVAPLVLPPSDLVDAVFDVCLPHSALVVRVSAAAVLRQLAIALPGHRVPLMDRCMTTLSTIGTSQSTCSPETISGYSLALGGLVAGSRLGDLGIPYAKGKAVFSLAEDLLRAANQNSCLTAVRTQGGWYLLGACMALGPTIVRPHVPRLILLWRNAFPRSNRELEAEKQRGDAFTWQVTLEARAGALCSMQAFLEYCAPSMANENVARRLLPSLDCALNLLGQLPDIVRLFGTHLAQPAAVVRLRLYRCLALLPPTAYSNMGVQLLPSEPAFTHDGERVTGYPRPNPLKLNLPIISWLMKAFLMRLLTSGGFNVLLRELVAEFTLTDTNSSTAVSLPSLLSQGEDSVVANAWCQNSDQQLLEEGIVQHSCCCLGSLGNDSAQLFLQEGLNAAVSTDASTADYAFKLLQDDQNDAPSAARTSAKLGSGRFAQPPEDVHSIVVIRRHHLHGPPGLASLVLEASICLFSVVLPYVSVRHRTQMLEHFAECIRVSKAARQEAIQINIFAALLCAWRRLADTKFAFGDDKALRAAAVSLAMSALSSANPVLRFCAAECVGRLVQVVGEPVFLAELAQTCFDQLRYMRDSYTRAGLCAAIGCLHRFVGGLACGQHLSTSVGVLLAVAQDSSAPTVQVSHFKLHQCVPSSYLPTDVHLFPLARSGPLLLKKSTAWALNALALTAESGGPMFREFVQPSLNLVLRLLLKTPFTVTDMHASLGGLLGALITTVGPELQCKSVVSKGACLESACSVGTYRPLCVRHHCSASSGNPKSNAGLSCLLCCSILLEHPDPLLKAEGIANFQRVHVFAPHLVNLNLFAPLLLLWLGRHEPSMSRTGIGVVEDSTEVDRLWQNSFGESLRKSIVSSCVCSSSCFLSRSRFGFVVQDRLTVSRFTDDCHLFQGCLTSSCFGLRRAVVACLRQISQKEANGICDVVGAASPQSASPAPRPNNAFIGNLPDETPSGQSAVTSSLPLGAVLFSLLDVETDARLRGNIEECILNLLQARGISHFSEWMRTLKQLLQATTTKFTSGMTTTDQPGGTRALKQKHGNVPGGGEGNNVEGGVEDDDDDDGDDDDDEQSFGDVAESRGEQLRTGDGIFNLPPKWPTRALAVACLHRLVFLCHEAYTLSTTTSTTKDDLRSPLLVHLNPRDSQSTLVPGQCRAHFDLSLARKLRSGVADAPWLVLHLGDLVRMTFIAATSGSDQLRVLGLLALRDVIRCFAPVPDPDSAGHYLLEQFQAQISAALRPAFTPSSKPEDNQSVAGPSTEPAPSITAAACEVCACWLTSGVPRDAADLRRIHELLTASLEILRSSPSSADANQVYSEASVTRLKLAVLSAWAEVFIASSRFRESALQAIQLLSLLESSGRPGNDDDDDVVHRHFLMMLGGGGGGCWGQPSVTDVSNFLEALEEDADDEEEEGLYAEDDDEEDDPDSRLDGQKRKKRFIRKLRRTVNESRHSYQLLSQLIGPDLTELASDWLTALRDFALINLPDELAFQRPTTTGAFYDTQAGIDQVRPFYARSWLVLLEAATLCMNTETKYPSESTYSPAEETDKQAVIPMTHIFLCGVEGMSMEAIADIISKPSTHVVAKCLRIVELLLTNPQSRPHFFTSSPRLPVELLSVLHRVILTRDSVALHLACMRVLHLILASATDKLRVAVSADVKAARSADTTPPVSSVGGGGEEGRGATQMDAAFCLGTAQSVEELFAYLTCPSASGVEAVVKALELADGGARSCFDGGDESRTPECRLTITVLQVVVCLLARYHPSVLQMPTPQSPPKQPVLLPKSSASRHRKAPVVLASAFHALTALLRICSPDVLSTSTKLAVSGVLPVMCQLVSRTTQVRLADLPTEQLEGVLSQPLPRVRHRRSVSANVDTQSVI